MNSLFLRNCINHGLPALTVPGVTAAFTDAAPMRLDFAEGWVENTSSGLRLEGGALPPMVLDILAAGGILPELAREGYIPIPA